MNDAFQGVADLLFSESWEIAIGTGTNPPWPDQKTLQNEVKRASATPTKMTTTTANDTIEFEATMTLDAPESITEFALFHLGSNAYMLCRFTQAATPIPASMPINVRIRVQVKA